MKYFITFATLLFLCSNLFAQTTVTTMQVYDINPTKASCKFTVQSSDYKTVDSRGVTWSQSHNPTINYSRANAAMTPQASGGVTFSGLKPNTLYFVRAFVKLKSGEVIYGNELGFTTGAASSENKNQNQNNGKKTEQKESNPKKG